MNPEVMVGKPVIHGPRIPLELIFRKLGEGACEADLLESPFAAHALRHSGRINYSDAGS